MMVHGPLIDYPSILLPFGLPIRSGPGAGESTPAQADQRRPRNPIYPNRQRRRALFHGRALTPWIQPTY